MAKILLEIELNNSRESVYLSSYQDAKRMKEALERLGAQVILKVEEVSFDRDPTERVRSEALAYARALIDVEQLDNMLNEEFGLFQRKRQLFRYAKEINLKFNIDYQIAREIVAQACRRK